MIDERLYQRLEEVVEKLDDLSSAVTPMYGGNNLQSDIKRIADQLGSATFELGRIATSLETIQKALTE